jgi:hypothetical protein
MKKTITIILTTLTFLACNKAKESIQNGTKNAMETVIESKTGTQVSIPDVTNMENNAGYISYKTDKTVYTKGTERMQATVTINKEKNKENLMIALQLVGETGKSFILTLGEVPTNFSLPLTGKFSTNNAYDGKNPTALFMFLNTTQNGVQNTENPFEGEFTIHKLSEKEVVFSLKGKGSNASNLESPSNWVGITGNGKLINPIILSYGIDKNNVLK